MLELVSLIFYLSDYERESLEFVFLNVMCDYQISKELNKLITIYIKDIRFNTNAEGTLYHSDKKKKTGLPKCLDLNNRAVKIIQNVAILILFTIVLHNIIQQLYINGWVTNVCLIVLKSEESFKLNPSNAQHISKYHIKSIVYSLDAICTANIYLNTHNCPLVIKKHILEPNIQLPQSLSASVVETFVKKSSSFSLMT
ncbi:hypothetical protein AGLY_005162 [Aphis glycines]|uniref:Uncharacterized protein n=1 Tax=Aphis glycines TaxID=307491 RepID=A0A6G0TWF4_APHGL|nr:hypothetical protein AGLY_005162 [Aphis glycines]